MTEFGEEVEAKVWVMKVLLTWEPTKAVNRDSENWHRFKVAVNDLEEAGSIGARLLDHKVVREFKIGQEVLDRRLAEEELDLARHLTDVLAWREHLRETSVAVAHLHR